MHTPKRMSLAETQARISNFFLLQCRREGAKQLSCVGCGGEIRRVRAYMSLHDERFGDACIGPARAWRMEIPYCAGCEQPPSSYGCIHMTEEEMGLPSVVEASRPFGRQHPEYRKQFPPLTLQADSSSLGVLHDPSEEHSQDGQDDGTPERGDESVHPKAGHHGRSQADHEGVDHQQKQAQGEDA